MSIAVKTTVADTYMELIGELPLRRINTATDYHRAMKLVLRLSNQEPDRGTADYLDVLVDLVADYEQRLGQTVDMADLSAADLVRHRLEQRSMSISALAREIGVPQSNLSEMLAGKRGWSKTVIRGLTKTLNIRVERFLA